jgi:distribution and morphology protein 31
VHSPQLEKSVLDQSGHIDSKKGGFRSHDIYHYYYPFKKPDPNGVVVGGESTRFGVLTDNDMRKQGYKRKVSSDDEMTYKMIKIVYSQG